MDQGIHQFPPMKEPFSWRPTQHGNGTLPGNALYGFREREPAGNGGIHSQRQYFQILCGYQLPTCNQVSLDDTGLTNDQTVGIRACLNLKRTLR